jgi:phosphatidylglycerophosphatase A
MEIVTTKIEERRSLLRDRIALGIATAGGAGFSPMWPGTAGSIVGVLVYLLIEGLNAGRYYPHAIIFFLIAGTWASWRVEQLRGHDAQIIVIDEVVGQMITFAAAAGRYPLPAVYIIIGFALFRFFDVVKPFPIRRLERFPKGIGVVADDVGAGILAMVVLTFIRYLAAGS